MAASVSGGLVLLQWAAQGAADGRMLLAAFALLVACVAGVAAWQRAPEGSLAWIEGGWVWVPVRGGTCREVPEVALDLQFVLLLRLGHQGPWIWLERWREPGAWSDIRRAVYSRAIRAALRQPHRQTRADAAS